MRTQNSTIRTSLVYAAAMCLIPVYQTLIAPECAMPVPYYAMSRWPVSATEAVSVNGTIKSGVQSVALNHLWRRNYDTKPNLCCRNDFDQ